MSRLLLNRISVRTALAIGCGATLGLWLYTGYAFEQRMQAVQIESNLVAMRYLRAQELLATVRSQMLLGSVGLRDILFSTDRRVIEDDRLQIEASYRLVVMALDDYEPVIGSGIETATLARLQSEVQQFHEATARVLAAPSGHSLSSIRVILNRDIAPKRSAALAVSDEVQELNRRAFVQQQRQLAAIHRQAERHTRWTLGGALAISMAVVLLTSIYAGGLEGRLRSQLRRDLRLSLELHDALARLDGTQETNQHNSADGAMD